jgi:hypothetical protein
MDGEEDVASRRAQPPEPSGPPLKTYVGFIWIGDEPGVRLNVSAQSLDEAMAAVEAEYGEGHVVSLWNERRRIQAAVAP